MSYGPDSRHMSYGPNSFMGAYGGLLWDGLRIWVKRLRLSDVELNLGNQSRLSFDP